MHGLDGGRAVTLNCNFWGKAARGRGRRAGRGTFPASRRCLQCRCTAAIIRHPNPAQGQGEAAQAHQTPAAPHPEPSSSCFHSKRHPSAQINKSINQIKRAAGVMLGEAGRLKATLCIDAVYFKNKKIKDIVYFYCYIIHFLVSSSCPLPSPAEVPRTRCQELVAPSCPLHLDIKSLPWFSELLLGEKKKK